MADSSPADGLVFVPASQMGLRLRSMAFGVLGCPVFDGPPVAFGASVCMPSKPNLDRLVDEPDTNSKDIRHRLPSTENRRTTLATEDPLLAGRRLVRLEHLLTTEKPKGRCGHRNDGHERAALSLAALQAVANLDGNEFTFDPEAHCSAQTTTGASHVPPARF